MPIPWSCAIAVYAVVVHRWKIRHFDVEPNQKKAPKVSTKVAPSPEEGEHEEEHEQTSQGVMDTISDAHKVTAWQRVP